MDYTVQSLKEILSRYPDNARVVITGAVEVIDDAIQRKMTVNDTGVHHSMVAEAGEIGVVGS